MQAVLEGPQRGSAAVLRRAGYYGRVKPAGAGEKVFGRCVAGGFGHQPPGLRQARRVRVADGGGLETGPFHGRGQEGPGIGGEPQQRGF